MSPSPPALNLSQHYGGTAKNLLFDGNGACYQLFASYYLNGYYASQEVVNSVGDLSLSSLYSYSQEHSITLTSNPAANTFDEAIEYDFADLWGAYDGERKITREELEKMISEVISIPSSDNTLAVADDVENGRVLVFQAFVVATMTRRIEPIHTAVTMCLLDILLYMVPFILQYHSA